MPITVQASVDELQPWDGDPDGTAASHLAPIPLCPFLESVDHSPTHWTVKARAPGTFRFMVVEGSNVVGIIEYTVIVGHSYRMNCNLGQEVRITC